MGVSQNSGTPKSSILIGFSIINHPFWGTTIFGDIHIDEFAIGTMRKLVSGHCSNELGSPAAPVSMRLP